MTGRPKNSLAIPLLVGILVALLAVFAVVVLSGGDDTATTTSTTAATTTSEATTTTEGSVTTGATTTTADTTTTSGATTTTFPGGTATVTHTDITGEPGANLTDVRIGDHEGFVRVVFDLTGNGTPFYIVGYETPPFTATSGDPVPVEGSAYLAVHLFPARRFDMDTLELTYEGDLVIDPGLDPIEQIVFVDDFEATMLWVIGLTAEKPFTVDVLQDPLRLVIDIAK